MAYNPSPMENFNRKNPLIIIAKKKYDKIVDSIQEFGKNFLRSLIFSITFTIISMLVMFFLFISKKYDVSLSIFILLILIYAFFILLILRGRRLIAYFLKEHDAMLLFDKVSNMQMNEILTLNNEEILDCIFKLENMKGEMDTKFNDTIHCINFYSILTIGFTIILLIDGIFI